MNKILLIIIASSLYSCSEDATIAIENERVHIKSYDGYSCTETHRVYNCRNKEGSTNFNVTTQIVKVNQ